MARKVKLLKVEVPTFTDRVGIKVDEDFSCNEDTITSQYYDRLWITTESGKRILNENIFAEYFSAINNIVYTNGIYYSKYGRLSEEKVERDIWESLVGSINTNVAPLIKRLKDTVKYASTVVGFYPSDTIIPLHNGDLDTSTWEFHLGTLSSVPYRLPCNLETTDVPAPYFQKWIRDLFYEDDIPTIQQYLGYTLLPTTISQKALFLVGEGGAGKSGMGVILEAMLGDATLNVPNTKEFLKDKFKIPELENKLTLYDDDLDAQALTETGFYKKLITNTQKIIADRKYGQNFEFTPRVRLIVCCNKMLSSVYDNSDGFWRRLLPVIVKPRDAAFVPDPQFYTHMRGESAGILQWALEGLMSLMRNGWVLPESKRSTDYLKSKRNIEDPLPIFVNTQFRFGNPGYTVTSKRVTEMYRQWCMINDIDKPATSRFIQLYLSDNAVKLGIEPTNNIKCPDGSRVRGYRGMCESTSAGQIFVTGKDVTIHLLPTPEDGSNYDL